MTQSCGGCTECCWYLGIEELGKAPCRGCTHVQTGIGCGIYPMRPRECADFACVWLESQSKPNPWPRRMRPDRSGVMFARTSEDGVYTAHTRDEKVLSMHPSRWFMQRLLRAGARIIRIIGPRRTLIHFVPREAGDLQEPTQQA